MGGLALKINISNRKMKYSARVGPSSVLSYHDQDGKFTVSIYVSNNDPEKPVYLKVKR